MGRHIGVGRRHVLGRQIAAGKWSALERQIGVGRWRALERHLALGRRESLKTERNMEESTKESKYLGRNQVQEKRWEGRKWLYEWGAGIVRGGPVSRMRERM